MTGELPYRDGNAMWAAITARSKTEALAQGVEPVVLLRQFVVDRFLARVFAMPDCGWVLKGGNAVLMRVHNARTTKDIDLLAEIDDPASAVERLRGALDTDLHDHFRFVITGVRAAGGATMQPDVGGFRVSTDAYCGVRRRQQFSVDLVTGSLMTAEPDIQTRLALVPTVPPAQVRLYPVVDHIADKLCATQSTYGTAGDQPSSRVRDLVDLVVFARTQSISGAELIEAINAEWTHRGLPGSPLFTPPDHWERRYPAEARRVPACGDTLTFARAVDLVAGLLIPVFDGSAIERRWSPETLAWERV
ncbi:nucleotidyl transferase AbiEii/AbiGii toxin family protein [Microbacterium sp. LRZ72]|uniref:nucleotidyl transferase AbiEii/AbiGii toxin family protein n=1 Tax=Microbacterium sp. LRZ72 TaxID=2942481 RepID=UPI0029A58475|nr:nucleotidyl transferase AbiEii/AbiGii toxin family protein [Microbacterium sp. LRZ72]MDX2377621.1 nucleotidyl transferase AbiEii/AbiGii toxin family protein [Microbacterium sp. LRZ72]